MAFLTHPEAHLFAIAFFISSVIAFIATAGLWRHHKLGWYSGIALVHAHIITITGFLNEERVRHLLLAEALKEGLRSPDLDAVVELITSVFTGMVLSALVSNMLLVTVLILPAILSSLQMPADIFSSRIKKGH